MSDLGGEVAEGEGAVVAHEGFLAAEPAIPICGRMFD
jgi:hypothetical protein